MSFNNKVVIVTGGSSGIGATTAILFAREGADVTVVGRNEVKLKKVEEEITKYGKKPLVIKADINKEEEAKTIVKETIDKFGKLDVLVNNAGTIKLTTAFDGNLLQVYNEIMKTNQRFAVLLTNLAAPHLVKTKGNIVNVSSAASMSALAVYGILGYCTSKAAKDHSSRVAAVELAGKGVSVNTVNPGLVETDIFQNAGINLNWKDVTEYSALKIMTQQKEVADLIIKQVSDKAKSVFGCNKA